MARRSPPFTMAGFVVFGLLGTPSLNAAPRVRPNGAQAGAPQESDAERPVEPAPSSAPQRLVVGADVVPYLGTSSSDQARRSVRVLSFNLVGGLAGGLQGFELGGVFNLQTGQVQGSEVAGAFNWVQGAVEGAQLGGAANLVRGSVEGVQLAGAFNMSGGRVSGLQLGGAANLAGADAMGLQLAGATNLALGDLDGAQVAGALNLTRGSLSGLMLGPVNLAAGDVHGVQVGVVNVAARSDFSLGLVNINTQGRTHIDAWAQPESALVAAGIKHGGTYWHSLYGLGLTFTEGGAAAVLGLGAHIPVQQRFFVDIDGLGEWLPTVDEFDKLAFLTQARAIFGYRLLPELAIFAGPSYNVLLSEPGAEFEAPDYAKRAGSSKDPVIHLWPGAVVGIQALTD